MLFCGASPAFSCKNERLLVFRAKITTFTLTAFSVLNGFGGTAADAGHTVSTGVPPGRFSVLKLNVVHNTGFGAFAAADALVGGVKSVGFYVEFVKALIDGA